MKNFINKLCISKANCFRFLMCFLFSVICFLSVFSSVIFVSASGSPAVVSPIPFSQDKFYLDTEPYFNVSDTFFDSSCVYTYKILFTYTQNINNTNIKYFGVFLSDTPNVTLTKDVNNYYKFVSDTNKCSYNYSYCVMPDGRKLRFGNLGPNIENISIVQTNCNNISQLNGLPFVLPIQKNDFTVSCVQNNTNKCYDVNVISSKSMYWLSCGGYVRSENGTDDKQIFSYVDFLSQTSDNNSVVLDMEKIKNYIRYGTKPIEFNEMSDDDFKKAFYTELYHFFKLYDVTFWGDLSPKDFSKSNDVLSTEFFVHYSAFIKATSSVNKKIFPLQFFDCSVLKFAIETPNSAFYHKSEICCTNNYSFSIPFNYFKTDFGQRFVISVSISDKPFLARTSLPFVYDFSFSGLGYSGSDNPLINNPNYTYQPLDKNGNPVGDTNNKSNTYDIVTSQIQDNGLTNFKTGNFVDSSNSVFQWIKSFLFIFPSEVTAIICTGLVVIIGIGIIRLVVG